MFFRLAPDGSRRELDLTDAFAGPSRTPCWIIGGGPSLEDLPTAGIAASPAPKFCVNLAGHGLLRPTFWTSYDPTIRFQRSIYLDPSITKFVHRARAMDLIPETTFKVCEAPATLFFDRDGQRGFHNFPAGSPAWQRPNTDSVPARDNAVTDWQDSLVQAIDIAYRLGFRTLYLAGCEMCVRPSAAQQSLAVVRGVTYHDREPLRDFIDRCRASGLTDNDLIGAGAPRQYHFDESKPPAAAIQTDWHYFRVAQYLRLSRRSLALAGLELVSVTPDSRLNDHFEYRPAAAALDEITQQIGDPYAESTRGKYTAHRASSDSHRASMRDFPPHNWSRNRSASAPAPAAPAAALVPQHIADRRARLQRALDDLPEIPVHLPQPMLTTCLR